MRCTTFCLSDCFSCARAAEADVFPYLLVNIGSGVSMLKAHYYALAVLPLKLFLYSSILVGTCQPSLPGAHPVSHFQPE